MTIPSWWWLEWYDLSAQARQLSLEISQKLWVSGGSYDWTVPQNETMKWMEHLTQNQNRNVKIVDCVTHALNCIHQSDRKKIKNNDIDSYVHQSVIDYIYDFTR